MKFQREISDRNIKVERASSLILESPSRISRVQKVEIGFTKEISLERGTAMSRASSNLRRRGEEYFPPLLKRSIIWFGPIIVPVYHILHVFTSFPEHLKAPQAPQAMISRLSPHPQLPLSFVLWFQLTHRSPVSDQSNPYALDFLTTHPTDSLKLTLTKTQKCNFGNKIGLFSLYK